MRTTIDTLVNIKKQMSHHYTSLQEYKSLKDSKTMAESQAKFYSQQIVNRMHELQPQR